MGSGHLKCQTSSFNIFCSFAREFASRLKIRMLNRRLPAIRVSYQTAGGMDEPGSKPSAERLQNPRYITWRKQTELPGRLQHINTAIIMAYQLLTTGLAKTALAVRPYLPAAIFLHRQKLFFLHISRNYFFPFEPAH